VLTSEEFRLAAQHVAEQHRGFVVEVVPGGEDVVAVPGGGFVEDVALRQPARRARRALRGSRAGFHIEPVLTREVDLEQIPTPLARKVARIPAGRSGVLADAEAEVQTVGVLAELA